MVDLLLLPFFLVVEWMCKCAIYLYFAFKFTFLFMLWMGTVFIWDMAALAFHIAVWILCVICKWRIPHLKAGKWLILYSKW